jgi:DNA polymerase I
MVKPKLDNDTVYLIDGSGYIFRAYFAIRGLRSKSGVPTNAVYGFTTMLIKLLKGHHPRYVGIAFDRKEPTFRHTIYKDYKANRPAPPEDLVPQFALIHRVVEAFNIKLLSMPGFEADDLIGTMTKRAHEAGRRVVIVTGDKDLMQLVDDNTYLLDELRAEKYGDEHFIGKEQVKEEFGVWPEQVVDVLALAGDASDNVPGVFGIGKKIAADLVNEFGSVEKVLEMAPLITQKSRREKIIDGHQSALTSKKLVVLDNNAPIDCGIEDLQYSGLDQDKFRALCLELDFNRLLSDKALFTQASVPQTESVAANASDVVVDRGSYIAVTTASKLDEVIQQLRSAKKIAVDTETDGLDSTTANLVGIAVAWGNNQAAYIPLAHKRDVIATQLELSVVREKINPILADSTKVIVAQNAKFDHKILTRHGFVDFKIGGDPMLESYLLHQDQEKHNLDDLSQKYLGHKPISFAEVCGTKNNQISFADVPLKVACEYSAEDADVALRLEELLLQEISASSLDKLYVELELPLEGVLSRMELMGVKLNTAKLHEAGDLLNQRLLELEKRAFDTAGITFNLASPKQVAEILFERLSLPSGKKTKTGYSTDSSVLEQLASQHELPQILLEHRMLAKLINTYIETLPVLINKATGRLHTSYNQFVTATGRLSSSDPNLQNIPARTKEGRTIRASFVAEPGYRLISLDYSQVELRILALVSQDLVLLDSFAKDQDVHSRTASEIFDVAASEVTKQQRDAAKTINFGLLYGMGAHRLAQTLKISRKEAQAYLDKYYERYAGVFRWKRDALKLAQEKLEVRTLFGRKRALLELASKNALEKARGERVAINTPIQGTAADIIKKSMIDTDAYLRKNWPQSHLIMQVHDELIIEAKQEDANKIALDVALIMRRGHGLDVDLKVDFSIADNWADAH